MEQKNQALTPDYEPSPVPTRASRTPPAPAMTKRGWWLVMLNVLLPGSAQVVAGNRILGRVACSRL